MRISGQVVYTVVFSILAARSLSDVIRAARLSSVCNRHPCWCCPDVILFQSLPLLCSPYIPLSWLVCSCCWILPCGLFPKCGKTYIGQTNRIIETRCKEHMRHLRLGQPDKSAIAQHALETEPQGRIQQHLQTSQDKRIYGPHNKGSDWNKITSGQHQQGWQLHTEPSLAARITSDRDLAARIENTIV
jgi:hypothetical protein